MPRIVADTNIYISALNFGGLPEQVLEMARRGSVQLFVSGEILREITGVLQRKFRWPASRIEQASRTIRAFATVVEPAERISVIARDESDNRVLECAVAARASLIVTGDSHLLDLRSFREIRVVTARAVVEAVR